MLIYFHYALINEIFAAKRDGIVDVYIEFGYSVPPAKIIYILQSNEKSTVHFFQALQFCFIHSNVKYITSFCLH